LYNLYFILQTANDVCKTFHSVYVTILTSHGILLQDDSVLDDTTDIVAEDTESTDVPELYVI